MDEAAAAFAGGVELAAAVELAGGCDCCEAVLLVADRAVPLVVGAAVEAGGGLRVVVEPFWVLAVELLLVLRVEPTSLRKREFMDVDDIYDRDIIAPAWQQRQRQQWQARQTGGTGAGSCSGASGEGRRSVEGRRESSLRRDVRKALRGPARR